MKDEIHGSPWPLLAQWRPGMGQEGTNATNPEGLQPSGFTEAGLRGSGALIPVGSNLRKGFLGEQRPEMWQKSAGITEGMISLGKKKKKEAAGTAEPPALQKNLPQ